MDPLRRFEKIEGARAEREAEEPAPPADLQRFEEAPTPRAEAPTESPAPPPTLEALILVLPTLECPACNGENSKFSRACRFCQHPLDGDDALAHNARRLEEQEVQRLKAEVELERRLARSVTPQAPRAAPPPTFGRLPPPPGTRLTVGLGAGLVLTALVSGSSSFSMLCMLGALGLGAWKVLGSRES
jgi:hypothetical protein